MLQSRIRIRLILVSAKLYKILNFPGLSRMSVVMNYFSNWPLIKVQTSSQEILPFDRESLMEERSGPARVRQAG